MLRVKPDNWLTAVSIFLLCQGVVILTFTYIGTLLMDPEFKGLAYWQELLKNIFSSGSYHWTLCGLASLVISLRILIARLANSDLAVAWGILAGTALVTCLLFIVYAATVTVHRANEGIRFQN